jgi:hypothetical protein
MSEILARTGRSPFAINTTIVIYSVNLQTETAPEVAMFNSSQILRASVAVSFEISCFERFGSVNTFVYFPKGIPSS